MQYDPVGKLANKDVTGYKFSSNGLLIHKDADFIMQTGA